MALQALRSAFRRGGDPADPAPAADAPADPMTAGGIDAGVFGCPACGRTILRGSARCEGCGQRLVLDVPVRRASIFVGAGLLAGFVVGGVLVGLTAPRSPAATAAASGAVGDTPGAASVVPAVVSSSRMAALRGTTVLNGRLAAEAEPLSRAIAAKHLDVADVVKVLRRMSTDTRAAAAMVPSLDGWTEAQAQQAALADFYAMLQAELDDGLSASVGSAGAYRATAKRVLGLLAQVPDLDAVARSLASAEGTDLPPVAIPDVLLDG